MEWLPPACRSVVCLAVILGELVNVNKDRMLLLGKMNAVAEVLHESNISRFRGNLHNLAGIIIVYMIGFAFLE